MKKEKLQNFDLAKMVCALLVICIHASPADGASAWVRFYVTDVMARIAVPLFYGMTGYLFFGRLLYENGRIKACTENRRRLLRQTLRTATLYLGWSAAYLLIVQIPDWYHAGWWGLYVVKDYLVALIFRGSYYHFWYLLAMLYAMPVLYGLLSIVPVRKAAVVAAVLWVCECLTYSYSWLGINGVYPVALIGEKMPIVFDALFRAVPLLFVGAFLSRYPPTGKMLRWAMPLGLLLLASEATLLYIHDSKSGLYSYLFSTLPAAYLLLRWLLQSKPVRIGPDTSLRLRGLSTTVYLIHPMVIELLSPLELPKGPVHFGTVTVLSILLSALYHRIPLRIHIGKES